MRKLLSLFLFASLFLLACERDTTNDAFATCITESGAKYFGAFWCPHCQEQKKLFGDSKDLLPYVECDPNGKGADPKTCAENQIESYPTWIFPASSGSGAGLRQTGVLSFEELSEKTSCPLPGNESVMRK